MPIDGHFNTYGHEVVAGIFREAILNSHALE